MNLPLRLIVVFGLAGLAATVHAEGDATAGKVKFETCRGCHAVPSYANAFPNYQVPMIGGQHGAHRSFQVLPCNISADWGAWVR